MVAAARPGPGGGGGGGAGGSSAGGTPAMLASGEVGAWGIAVDGANVYWTNQDRRTVMKVSLAAGRPVMVAAGATAAQIPWDLAIDGSAVYWNYYSSPGAVMTAPLAAARPSRSCRRQAGPRNIAVRGANVYWINLWIFGANTGAVMTAPLAGGGPVALASAQDDPNGVTADDTNVYWTNLAGTIMKVAVAAARR